MMTMTQEQALRKAIFLAGGGGQLGLMIGRSKSAVGNWLLRGSIPPGAPLQVARALNWQVTPHELDPEQYPIPTDGIPPEVLKEREIAAA